MRYRLISDLSGMMSMDDVSRRDPPDLDSIRFDIY